MVKYYLSLIVIIILFYNQTTFGANVRTILEYEKDHYIEIEGEIIEGDFQKIINLSRTFIKKGWPIKILINSKGGNAVESMKIGRFVKDAFIEVKIKGNLIKVNSNTPIRYCYSSCVLIFIAAPVRDHEGDNEFFTPEGSSLMIKTSKGVEQKIVPVIGIHRPYFDKASYAKLSATQAKQNYGYLEKVTRQYLQDMGAPVSFIDRMFLSSSNEVEVIKKEEFLKYFGYKEPYLEEWLLSKCGGLDKKEMNDWASVMADRIISRNDKYIPSRFSKGYIDYLTEKQEKADKCKEAALMNNQKEVWKKLSN